MDPMQLKHGLVDYNPDGSIMDNGGVAGLEAKNKPKKKKKLNSGDAGDGESGSPKGKKSKNDGIVKVR
jgi:hypothetical protein